MNDDSLALQNIAAEVRPARRDRERHTVRPVRENPRRNAIRDGKNM